MIALLQAAWLVVKGVVKAVPWWAWLAIAVAVAFFVYGERRESVGFHKGQAERQGLWDAATAQQEQRIRELEAKVETATADAQVQIVERVKTVHEKGATIIQRIPQLVPVGSCDLPAGFRVLHDAAASSSDRIPDATARAD